MSDRPAPTESPAAAPHAGTAVSVRVPAKINLFLSIRGVRQDGYHELVTVYQTVSLYDRVVARMEDDPTNLHPAYRRFLSVTLSHDGTEGVPGDKSNLAMRAAHVLMDALGGSSGAAHALPPMAPVHTYLSLEKQIPVAGGMAGGSADAAATLVALNELWDGGMSTDELQALASELGADVPFCVSGGTSLATGTGAATADIMCRGAFHWVVGISRDPLPTPGVYRAFDEVCSVDERDPAQVLAALRSGDADQLAGAVHNDLQGAAFHLRPSLHEGCEAMRAAGALTSLVSGSGPTILGLAADGAQAAAIADRVRGSFDRVEVVHSPAGGPSVTPAS